MTDPHSAMQIDVELVRQLADMLDATQLTEIEVQDGERRVRVARKAAPAAPAPVYAQAAPQAAPAALPAGAPTPAETGASAPAMTGETVRSPMVGTAYLSAEPGAKPFVAPGQRVSAGDTILIVEAMKVMNPIVAPSAGTVREVLVSNGQPIEFDQPLAIIE